jgi:hypothetical protein
VDQLATVIGVAVFFGLAFALGDWVLGVAEARTESRLRPGWRWLTLPIAATLCFAGFLLLRPLIVDQPRTPLWFVIGLVAIALLIAGATALGYAAVAFGSWAIASLRGGQFHGPARDRPSPRARAGDPAVFEDAPRVSARRHIAATETTAATTDPGGGWREGLMVAGAMAGCLIAALGFWVVLIGVPIALYVGFTTGEWGWLIGLAVFGAVVWGANRLGLIRSLND